MRPAQPVLAAVLILLVLGLCWRADRPLPLGGYDQRFYLGIAFDLRRHHRFTDGFAFAGGDDRGVRPPGMRFTPLYPAILAAAATLDPAFARATDCLVAHRGDGASCGGSGGHVRQLQFAMLAAVFCMLWWQGALCGGGPRTGWLALGIALPAAPVLLRSVDSLMTESVALFLVMLFQSAALRCVSARRRRTAWAVLAGAALGAAVLTRPAFLLLALPCCAAAVGVAAWPRRPAGRRSRIAASAASAAFCAATLLPVGAWMLRNRLVLHRTALSFGYASHTLVQRLSFDSMRWRDWLLSFPCFLPDGNGIGALLTGDRHACDRFGWDDPDGFYAVGIGPLLSGTLREAGGWAHHMRFLLDRFLFAHPLRQLGWHALVSVPMALHGVGIDHWWGVALALPCAAVTVSALRRRTRRAGLFLILALPGWLMLWVGASIAVNQPRYNLMLLAPFSVAAALLVDAPRRRNRRAGSAADSA